MGKYKKATVGYKYYMGIHMGIGRGPVDEICEIRVGDRVAWEGSITDNTTIQINKENLFGGTKAEGGIKGPLDIMMGGPNQTASSGLRKMLKGPQPQFRGMVTAFFDGMVCAMSPYPKSWAFRLRRVKQGWDGGVWYPEKAVIWLTGYDAESKPRQIMAMNPAHIIYEALTNRSWGLGRDRDLFLDDAWRHVADQLYEEGFGLCLRWSRQDTLMSFVQTVVDHIAGALYIDKFTGKYKIKLIREDYDADSLPVLDMDSGLLSIDEATNASPYNLMNEIVVNWHNAVTNTDSQVREHNLALIQTQGALASDTRDYPGLPTAGLALLVAKRDLKSASTNVRRFSLTMDRRAWRAQPADVLKIRDPQSRGIETVIVRVGTVEESGQADGKIKVVCVQDMFGVDLNTFGQVQPPQHVEPDYTPKVARRLVYETTYAELSRYMSAGEFAQVQTMEGYLRAHAEKPTDISMAFDIAVKPQGATDYIDDAGSGEFTPLAELTTQISYLDKNLTLDKYSLAFEWDELEPGQALHIGEEMMVLESWDESKNLFVVGRGVMDTVPRPHFGGDEVWLITDTGGSDWTKYLSGEHLDVKLLPWTLRGGKFPIDLAPVDSLDFKHRFIRPYPPGHVLTRTLAKGEMRWYQVQDLRADVGANEVPDALDITWTHRDRVVQQDQLIEHELGDIGPEPGQTYRLRVFDYTGVMVRNETGIVGTRYLYTYDKAAADLQVEQQAAEFASGVIYLDSMRDGYESWQYYVINFIVHKKPPQTANVSMMAMSVASEPTEETEQYDDPNSAQTSMMTMQAAQTDDGMEGGADDTGGMTVASMSESASQTTKLPPVIDALLVEAPYLTLVRDGRDLDRSQVMAFAARPSDRLTDGFDLYHRVKTETSWKADGAQPWTPWGQLTGFISFLTGEFDVDPTSDSDGVPLTSVQQGDVLMVDNELMVVESVDGKHVKVGRGTVDTVPAVHYGGAVVWFYDRAHAMANHNYGDKETAELVLVPHSYTEPLTPDDMPVRELEMQYRPKRPYPPGLLLANGNHWYERVDARADPFDYYAPKGRDVIFTWAHRNRIWQNEVAYDHYVSGINPEKDVQYRIWIGYYNGGKDPVTLDTLYTADAGWVLSAAQALVYGERAGRALKAEGNVMVLMAINAVRDGLYNWQGYSMQLLLPSIPMKPGSTPGGGTVTPPVTYPPVGTPGTTTPPSPGTPPDPDSPPTTPPPPDPDAPPTNPDPDVPDTSPPPPPPPPAPDPDNVPGWSLQWDHGWAAGLPSQTTGS